MKPDQTPGANQDAGGIPVGPWAAAPDAGLREAAQRLVDGAEAIDGVSDSYVGTRDVEALRAALAAHPAPAPDDWRPPHYDVYPGATPAGPAVCPICGGSEDVPNRFHDHRANFEAPAGPAVDPE